MPPKLKSLSGKEVITALGCFGFVVHTQRGSHIKLRRTSSDKSQQTLTIPNHKEIDRGTLRAIFRQASRYISEADLFPYFYSK